MAPEIQGADMEVGYEPRRKEIKPMSMRRTAMDAEDRRSASRAIVQVVEPQSASLDKVLCVGGLPKASLRSFDTLVHVLLIQIR
jgi:hypothetical protein